MSLLISKLSELNPFSKDEESDDEIGEEIDNNTVAGGGHGATQAELHKADLRVSSALRHFLAHEARLLSEEDAGVHVGDESKTDSLCALLMKHHINVPPKVIDRSFPLPEYFVSSSHNTYLMAHQLYGTSAATAYETALRTGSRCVEIDAWDDDDNPDEPKVTHGYTLVSNIPFRAVCETIRDVVDREAESYSAAPVIISLENHCDAYGQRRMVEIMYEVFGGRLLSSAVNDLHGIDPSTHVPLSALGNKIMVIVEYHLPEEAESSSSSSSSESEDEEEKNGRHVYKEKKKKAPSTIIVPELASLGVYAQSVKPKDNSWYTSDVLKDGPHHHLINVSETNLATHLPAHRTAIAKHNSKKLMRVYPKGTRISSRNLNPVPFWGLGAQICALNWQTFGASMQINDALFSGTEGYVLKPAALRTGGDGNLSTGRKKKLILHVAGASEVPVPKNQKEGEPIKPYLTCTLYHPDDGTDKKPAKQKTSAYKPGRNFGFLGSDESSSLPTDPIWNETLEWEYEENELVFLRILIKSQEGWSKNPKLAVAAERVMYLVPGWSFVRMLDLHGHESNCSLLVKFLVEDC